MASIDGEKAILSRWAKVMEEAGLRREYKGHVVSVSVSLSAGENRQPATGNRQPATAVETEPEDEAETEMDPESVTDADVDVDPGEVD